MNRSTLYRTTMITGLLIPLIGLGCGGEDTRHCGNKSNSYSAEWDYNHGDRCVLQISEDGDLELAPSDLVLEPAAGDLPSALELTIIGYSEGKVDKPGPKTYADGYVVDVEVSNDCKLLLSLESSPETDPCLVDTPTHLRCLLDPAGVTSVVVTTLLDHPTTKKCEITVESGEASKVSTVAVAPSLAELDLVIHLASEGIRGSTCGTVDDPCTLAGGRLSESVCVESSGASSTCAGSVPFYVAMEVDEVQAVIADNLTVDLTSQSQQYTSDAAFVSSSSTCESEISETTITTSGQSPMLYLCTGGLAGTHEIRARTRDGTNNDSVFLSVPPIPTMLKLMEGDEENAPFSFIFVAEDCQGQSLDEQLLYRPDGEKAYGIKAGTPLILKDKPPSFAVDFVEWDRSCSFSAS